MSFGFVSASGRLRCHMALGFCLDDRLADIPFDCVPFSRLIQELSSEWSDYHIMLRAARKRIVNDQDRDNFEAARARLSDPEWLKTLCDHYLNKEDGWLADDVVPDQFEPMTSMEEQRVLDKLHELTYVPTVASQSIKSIDTSKVGRRVEQITKAQDRANGLKRFNITDDSGSSKENIHHKRRKLE